MVRLPAALERRLALLLPRARDRQQFVTQVVEEALRNTRTRGGEERPERVGGTLHLFTDGGSRGNPGQAAIAFILEDPASGTIIKQGREAIGVQTNNVAEYQALIAGLEAARAFHPNRLVCHLDSELIVKQLSGAYAVRMQTLQQYVDEIHRRARELPSVAFVHIPRTDNFRADALVNQALDEQEKATGRMIREGRGKRNAPLS